MTPRLACTGLTAARGPAAVLSDLDIEVDPGRILALLGPNGTGKTTLLLTVAGLLPALTGTIVVDGTPLPNGSPTAASRAGIVLVPDNRCLFTSLTVEQNLAVPRRRGGPQPRDMIETFPALERRWEVKAGALSGSEQQMLALARALIQEPKVLLIDEMSMGLAPLIVETLFGTVRKIAEQQGTSIVLVEQHVKLSLEFADDAIVLNHGRAVLRDSAAALRHDDRVERAYFDEMNEQTPQMEASR